MIRARTALLAFCILLAIGTSTLPAAEPPKSDKSASSEATRPMDWMAFVAKLVEFTAWPIVTLIIFYHYRDQLHGLLGRMTKFEGPGIKGEFDKGLEKAEKEADAADLPAVPIESMAEIGSGSGSGSGSGGYGRDESVFPELIRKAPDLAITHMWRIIEEAVQCRYGDYSYSSGTAPRVQLPDRLKKLFDQLRKLRNKAAHAKPGEITSIDAQEFIDLARRFLAATESDE